MLPADGPAESNLTTGPLNDTEGTYSKLYNKPSMALGTEERGILRKLEWGERHPSGNPYTISGKKIILSNHPPQFNVKKVFAFLKEKQDLSKYYLSKSSGSRTEAESN